MAWWDDLWLNEGFAEYVEYIGMDHIDPSWKVWEQFVIDVVQYVFDYDQIQTSHPLFNKAKTVEEMEQYFDSISYEKGASVIRMIEFCLSTGTFRRGLQRYLSEHKYANAEHTDLWNALTAVAHSESKTLDVAGIMNTWTLQMGFPVVTVQRLDTGFVKATQKRFLINPDATDPGVFTSPYGYQWEIPLTMASSNIPDFDITERNIQWLHKEQQTETFRPWVPMPLLSDPDGWFVANVHQYGYYRVNYDPSNWNALSNQLKKNHTIIPPINRAQIMNDAWNLASAGEMSIEIALGTLEYLDKEQDYVPWSSASSLLGDLRLHMSSTPTYGTVQRFARDKVAALFERLGMDDTNAPALESYTRDIAVRLACQTGLTQCVEGAKTLFKQWKNDPENNPISPSLRRQVYCTAVSEGDQSDWLFVRMRFEQEQSPSEKDLLRRALSCSRSVWILNKLLDMALSGDIKRDDATGTIGDVANNAVGTALAWHFIRANWNTIINDFAQSNSRLKYMIDSIVSKYSSSIFYQEFKSFMDSQPELGRAEQVLKQALETIEYNMKWNRNSYSQIVQWLAARGYTEFSGPESNTGQATVKNVRLPSNLRPLNYEIVLEPNMYGPDPSTFTFNGTLVMTFHCEVSTNQIILHINELQVSDIRLPSGPGVLSHSEDKELQFLIITLTTNLTSGVNYTVSMTFEGPLDTATLDGLYLSSYKKNNNTVYLATTQFEATDARKAFPCMDEPALKATFDVTLIRRSFNKALSNMPVVTSTNLGGDRVADKFMKSLPMSTYLVAFIVCDFEHKTKMTKRNITYEVWSRAEAIDQVDFALDFGVLAIDYFEDYFQVPFPLPKQSMIAIPDFAAGAMENWGLITYKETRILFEPGVSSLGNMESGAMTIAHELAHMWFGDLVSPQWWDELWLNEGFASFMQFLATDHINPDWKEWDQFVVANVHAAMRMDGLVSSHPVYVPVATPEQIVEIFDAISYSKGASIIRMIRHAVGEDTFKHGLTNYLTKLAYKNAVHEDLWNALNEEAHADGRNFVVGDVMDTWTKQMNFPVVKVTTQGQTLTLTQQRYLKDPSAPELGKYTSPYGYKWDIPFTYTTSRQPNFTAGTNDIVWLNRGDQQKAIPVNNLQAGDWVVGNLKEVGYYRVNYDDDNWNMLATQLRQDHTVIDPVNRAQIIDDAWSLASGGYLNQSIALEVMEYLDKEMDYVPWRSASQQLEYVGRMLSSTEFYGAFKEFMANKTSNQYAALGMNNTGASLLESFFRSHIAFYACNYDGPGCITDAKNLFNQWRANPDTNPIQPELRSAVYCAVLRNGDLEDWEFLLRRLDVETNANEIDLIQNRLACTSEPWVLRRLLNLALYSGKIRSQDSVSVIAAVLSNPSGTSLAWEFIRESWDDIFERYRKDPFALKNLVDRIGETLNTRVQLQEVQAFVESHPDLGTGTRAFQAAMETIRSNVKWMDKNYSLVKNWLERQGFGL